MLKHIRIAELRRELTMANMEGSFEELREMASDDPRTRHMYWVRQTGEEYWGTEKRPYKLEAIQELFDWMLRISKRRVKYTVVPPPRSKA